MSFFGNHINLTPASQSDWNKNNSKDAAHIKNRPFFIDDNGEIHKLNKKFLPNEVAMKEDIKVTSVNGMTGDVIIPTGSGGAGVAVQPDWNQNDKSASDYIKNRTHYIEDEKKVNVIPETTVGWAPGVYFYDNFSLEENTLYTVSVNGAEYELIGRYYEPGDSIFIGNQYFFTGIDEGSDVPFAIIPDPEGDAFFIAPTFGVYDISISTSADSILSEERLYLCWKGWPYYKKVLKAGNSYKVIFDNYEYYFTAVENSDADAIIIGDMTQYPFEIWYAYDDMMLYSLAPGIHTVAVIDETNDLEIIYQQNIGECCNYWGDIRSPYEIKEGQTYQITYGENIYSCTVKPLDVYGNFYLGNPAYGYLWDEWFPPDVQSTGEPFFIECYSDDIRLVYSYGAMEKFAIEIIESKVHTLDPKFLPEGIGYIETKKDILVPEQTLDVDDELYTQFSQRFTFIPGEKYKVVFNGEPYECVAWHGGYNGICIGNGDIYGGGGFGDGEPFCCNSYYGGDCYLNVEAPGEYTIQIERLFNVYHKIDKNCLPEDVVTSVGMTQSDWNENDEDSLSYINNKTHYIRYEGPASYTSQVGEFTASYFDGYLSLKQGASYTVTVNDSEYNLVGQYVDGWVLLGDSYYLNGTHNSSNAPFAIVGVAGGPKLFAPYGVYDISLVEDASGNAINERVYICWDYYSSGHKLTAGNTYEVIFDDSVYEFIAAENAEGSIIIGDVTQYPFEIETVGSYNSLTLHSLETGVHTFSLIDITNNELIIDNKYVGKIQSSYIPSCFLKENQEYRVSLDGNMYYCKAKRDPYSNTIYIGNLAHVICNLSDEDIDVSNFDFQNTKELFFIADASVKDTLVLYSGDSISEFSIETIISDIQTLDPKFLPVSATHTRVGQSICDEAIFVEYGSGGNYLNISEPLEIDQLYEIQVNDKVYHIKCQEFEGVTVLGNILLALMAEVGNEVPPALLEILMGLIEALVSIMVGTSFDLYKEIPFGIIYDRSGAGFISNYPGMYKIKISPVLELSPISKTLLPKIKLPTRTVYETIDILAGTESNQVQASDGTTLYVTKLSNSEFFRAIPEAMRTGGVSLMSLSNVHMQQMAFGAILADVPLIEALVETENTRIAIIDVYKELKNIEGAPKYDGIFMCVEEESSISDIDFTFTPGLWFISTSALVEGVNTDVFDLPMNKLVFATSNDIADIGIIPERIARIEDISIQYDTLKSCGEEKVYAEWSKEKVYPELSSNTKRVLLSNENFCPKQLYGKHYLIKRETENGVAVIDKIITPFDIINAQAVYSIDEIQFFNPDFSGMSGYLLALMGDGSIGITFPKEPEDESLIYFKIYEPAKQLDDSLLSNNIARKEDLPCYDEILYYEWNEDTEYETSVDAPANDTYSKMVKISNDAPDSSFFLGKTLSMCYLYDGKENRRDVTLSEELLAEALEGITYSLGDTAIVVMADSFTFDNGVTLTKGIWSMSEYLEDSSMRGLWWKVYDPAKTIEEKYLPDTVVKSSDLQGKTLINPEIASVGQLMMVEEIDESGAPIKWRAVDANSLLNAILPPISEEDNGKTLTVVDGTWQLI